MATLSIGIASPSSMFHSNVSTRRFSRSKISCVQWSRVAPDTSSGLIEYFLDTEAQEIEFEIARLRPRLNKELFSDLQLELGQLRFAVSKTEEMEDRIIELEKLQKALQEGTEAYDKMQDALVKAKDSLGKILSSKDMKATLLEMVETNELNTALLSLLDENIVSAQQANQKQAAEFMEKLCGAVLKYISVDFQVQTFITISRLIIQYGWLILDIHFPEICEMVFRCKLI